MKRNKDWIKNIATHAYVRSGDYIYFPAMNFNALYQLNILDRKMEILGSIPNERWYSKHLYGAIAMNGGKLYMPPMNATEIAVYNICEKSFKKIKLSDSEPEIPSKFFGVIADGNYVYLIPCRYHSVVRIDVRDDSVTYIDIGSEKYLSGNMAEHMLIKNGYFIKDKYLYMALYENNVIIKVNLENLDVEHINIGKGLNGFVDMCVDGDVIWLVQNKVPKIIKWNEVENSVQVFNDFPEDFECIGEIPFINIINMDSYIFVASYQANMSLRIEKQTHKITKASWDVSKEKIIAGNWNAKHYFAKKTDDNKIIINYIADHSIVIADEQVVAEFQLIDENGEEHIRVAQKDAEGFERESENFELKDFIDELLNAKQDGKAEQMTLEIGERIYRQIKNSV